MMREVIAKSPTHGKWLTYICQAPAWDGKSHFRFEDKPDNAVIIPAASMRPLAANFHITYPDAMPLEFHPITNN